MSITGSTGTSLVLWYGKEGPYEVIVLEQLGNSLSDLINKEQLEYGRVFSYASQMVRSWYLLKRSLLNFLTALSGCVTT